MLYIVLIAMAQSRYGTNKMQLCGFVPERLYVQLILVYNG